MFDKRALIAISVLLLAACGGSGGGTPALPGAGAPQRSSSAVFTISVPAKTGAFRSPAYVSANTQSLTIAVNGGSTSVTQNLTPTSGGCTTSAGAVTCNVSVTAPVGNDTFSVAVYSGTNASGNKLGTGSVSATVSASPTPVSITLDGVVASVAITLANTMPYSGSATSIPVTVVAKDASGATIVAPGGYSPQIALTDSDTSGHTSLSPATVPDSTTAVTLNYDGSASVSSATISASITGSITTVTPAKLTPQTIENGGGGVGVVTLAGKTYAEVPTAAGLLQVQIAAGGALPSPSPSASPQTSVLALNPEPDACSIAPNGGKIYAYCVPFYSTPAVIHVVDLTTGTPALVNTISTDATVLVDSSGGECYICGVVWDPRDSAILISTHNGYEFYDPVTGKQVRPTIPVIVAENFGYNPVTNQIWSPQEETNNAEEDLVDVASSTWYTLTPSISSAIDEPDAGAIDSSTNVAMTVDEFSGNTAVVPLSGAVLATPVPVPSAPPQAGTLTDPNVTTEPIMNDAGCETNAVSIDPQNHVAFLSGEFSSPDCVGAVQLPSSAPVRPFTPSQYMWIPALPNTPDGGEFDSALDPHVAATFYLPGNGDLYGLVFNYSRSYVAVVDITKLLVAPGSTGDAHVISSSYDLFANGILTYVPTGSDAGPAGGRRPHARGRH